MFARPRGRSGVAFPHVCHARPFYVSERPFCVSERPFCVSEWPCLNVYTHRAYTPTGLTRRLHTHKGFTFPFLNIDTPTGYTPTGFTCSLSPPDPFTQGNWGLRLSLISCFPDTLTRSDVDTLPFAVTRCHADTLTRWHIFLSMHFH